MRKSIAVMLTSHTFWSKGCKFSREMPAMSLDKARPSMTGLGANTALSKIYDHQDIFSACGCWFQPNLWSCKTMGRAFVFWLLQSSSKASWSDDEFRRHNPGSWLMSFLLGSVWSVRSSFHQRRIAVEMTWSWDRSQSCDFMVLRWCEVEMM